MDRLTPNSAALDAALADAPALAAVSLPARQQLATLGTVRVQPSGSTLFVAGDPATEVFLVLQGRVQLTADGLPTSYAARADLIGAEGILTAEPRTATARAVRDSTVLAVDAEAYTDFLDANPGGYRSLANITITNLKHEHRGGATGPHQQGTFAVVPSSAHVPVQALAETMVQRLAGWPEARLVTADHVDAALGAGVARAPLTDVETSARIAAWLDDLERRHRYLVFAADSGRDPWAARCLNNADRILVLAEAMSVPSTVPVLEDLKRRGLVAPVELVLLRPDGDPSPHTLQWREVTGARAHYFVHPWDRAQLDSLARQVTARGVALVLGGGGARGFAHIGLIRALEELHIPIDITGGTSMGSFIAALAACGYNSFDMTEIARETFVRTNHLNDYALPRVSIIKGRKFADRLHSVFGDRLIEELRRTFFCVCTNLSTGDVVICDKGPVHQWVGISMAVPGVAPPAAFNGDLLCDGGIVDNLPIAPMRRLERGAIIACNVSSEGTLRAPGAGMGEPDFDALLKWKGSAAPPKLAEILVRTATLSSALAVESAAATADAYVRMPVQDFGMFDWKRLDELVELGYDYAMAQLGPHADGTLASGTFIPTL